MQAEPLLSVNSVGYLTSFEDQAVGFVGGVLVVNQHARPIEFHCTIPCRPSAAQRVLYGSTLQPHLLTDQIPETLLSKLKSKLDVILVNDLTLLKLREKLETPIGCLHSIEPESAHSETNSSAQNEEGMTIGNNLFLRSEQSAFAVHNSYPADASLVRASLAQISASVEIDEPLERLKIAIEETCKPNSNAA